MQTHQADLLSPAQTPIERAGTSVEMVATPENASDQPCHSLQKLCVKSPCLTRNLFILSYPLSICGPRLSECWKFDLSSFDVGALYA